MKKVWIYDLETLEIFTATFEDRDSNEIRTFVLSNTINQIPQLLEFLKEEVAGLIGYNCIHFDSQILEYIIQNPNCSAGDIQIYANKVINENIKPDVPEYKLSIPHLDLFRALSLSVKAKRTSLKWCEFSMDLDNIEDLPESNYTVESILSYNYNDVYATKQLYIRYIKEIELRKDIGKREGINLLNSTEPDISKKLFTKWLAKPMSISEKDLRNTNGTNRPLVKIKDIIFPYVEFKTKVLQEVLAKFQSLELKEGQSFELSVIWGNIVVDYGLGGIHGVKKNTIINSTRDYIIKSCDVKSYYPNLAIRNGLHPKHIPGKIFCSLYEGLYEERIAIPKSDPRNYILKIALNALYGLTNDKYSFLRDRQFTLTICINGQLLLSMLFEELLLQIPNSKMIMINTDGGEIYIPKEYEDLYYSICKEWEEKTKLVLEYDNYKKLIISDVNNYIGLFDTGKTKCKGKYEFKDIPLHKNKSFSIIPKAIFEYFINNIPIEETIKNERNIFMFCGGVKAQNAAKKGKAWYELHSIHKRNRVIEKLSKTVRYFISTNGKYLIKAYENGDFAHVEAPKKNKSVKIKDWKVTYFNKAFYPKDFKEYNIDYSYYISKARDIINTLEDEKIQLNLF